MKIRFAFLLLLVGLVATVSSCSKRTLNALNPCTINGVVQNVPVNPQRALDLLIVIDDSESMREEQAKLQAQVPRLVNLLITGGAADPNAVGEFPAIESLHVGIITPDLGYSTEPDTGRRPPEFTPPGPPAECTLDGKAGFMQVEGSSGCTAMTPGPGTLYLSFVGETDDPNDLITDVECLTGQANGCGFEQQLESILASDRNTANGGFNRQDALLAIILITDEDDCSTTDPRVFDTVVTPGNPYQGPLTTGGELQPNLRCWYHSNPEDPDDEGALQAIQRYVDEVAKLKSDPSQIVFAAITGVPEDENLDLEGVVTELDRYEVILADDEMIEEPNPATDDTVGQQLRPACTATDGSGSAAPGRRIVETMQGLAEANIGIGTVVESICANDYAPALNAIVDRIAAALRQLCLPRPLNRDSNNMVGCEVREVQPDGQTCADAEARGREPTPVGTEDGREVCRVTQLPSDRTAGTPAGLGWFYDDFTGETQDACTFNPEAQRVSFTVGAEPVSGARIRFECLQAAPPNDVDVGWPCSTDADCERSAESLAEQYDRDNLELVCDPDSNTCQLTCESDVQCPGGFACYDASGDGSSYCVNPTCQLN